MKYFHNLRTATILLVAAAIFVAWTPTAVAEEPNESQVKAAFVYNFTQYIQWQNRSQTVRESKLLICILGDDPLANTLELLRGKITSGGPISVMRISKTEETDRCKVVYFGKSEKDQMKDLLKGIKEGVLTIGEMKNFASSGGIINFVIAGNRVSFEINTDASERAGLKVSSQLLKLAKIVKDGNK
jgi:hypothetical protein